MWRSILASTLMLALFGLAGSALVAFTWEGTRDRIAMNEKQELLRALHAIVPPELHDNDIYHDTLELDVPSLQGRGERLVAYRARRNGEPVAVVLTTVAPNGYSGAIHLLVGVRHDGTLAGVRVVSHHETPGLGDGIEEGKSDWILRFTGRSLGDPPLEKWKVKRDGGVFDQFTGATITPRAVVQAVRRTLVFFREHREELFAPAPTHSNDGGSEDG